MCPENLFIIAVYDIFIVQYISNSYCLGLISFFQHDFNPKAGESQSHHLLLMHVTWNLIMVNISPFV